MVCADTHEAMELALRIVRPRGTVVLVGFPVDGFRFDPRMVLFKEVLLKGSLLSNVAQAREMVELVVKHGVRSQVTIVSLDEVPRLLEMYASKELKGRLVMKIED